MVKILFPCFAVQFFPYAVGLELVVSLFQYILFGRAAQQAYQKVHAGGLSGPVDAAQGFLHQDAPVETLGRILADVAVPTVAIRLFAEIAEQDAAAADIRFAVAAHAVEFLQINILLIACFRHVAMKEQVAYRVEQERVAWPPVASGTPDFLIIVFDASRHVEVNDPTDIAFVDSHPESHCRTDHPDAVVDEIFLCPFAHLVRQSGVVGNGSDAVFS